MTLKGRPTFAANGSDKPITTNSTATTDVIRTISMQNPIPAQDRKPDDLFRQPVSQKAFDLRRP
jgi:hypothetical protein